MVQVIQVIQVVQVVQVVRTISLDDMHSENIWLTSFLAIFGVPKMALPVPESKF